MKLIRLRSIANEAVRSTAGLKGVGYMHDPFYYFTPVQEIVVDLVAGTLTPDMEGDDVEKYYKGLSAWFHDVLPKEGIPIEIIDQAIIRITPDSKECIIQAQGKTFRSFEKRKRKL